MGLLLLQVSVLSQRNKTYKMGLSVCMSVCVYVYVYMCVCVCVCVCVCAYALARVSVKFLIDILQNLMRKEHFEICKLQLIEN